MSLGYIWEKFHAGVLCLAQGTGSQAFRLEGAFESIGRLDMMPTPMPTPDIQEAFNEIRAASIAKGTYQDSARALGEWEAHKLIEKIVGTYDDICRLKGVEDANNP